MEREKGGRQRRQRGEGWKWCLRILSPVTRTRPVCVREGVHDPRLKVSQWENEKHVAWHGTDFFALRSTLHPCHGTRKKPTTVIVPPSYNNAKTKKKQKKEQKRKNQTSDVTLWIFSAVNLFRNVPSPLGYIYVCGRTSLLKWILRSLAEHTTELWIFKRKHIVDSTNDTIDHYTAEGTKQGDPNKYLNVAHESLIGSRHEHFFLRSPPPAGSGLIWKTGSPRSW